MVVMESQTAQTAMPETIRYLQRELKRINEETIEGAVVKLPDEENLLVWQAGIYGPPNTLYEGGYFKVEIKFPHNYPQSPPKIEFLTPIWHPNVFIDGKVCMSALHSVRDTRSAGWKECEMWSPVRTPESIILSLISLLDDPDLTSFANEDAAHMCRKWLQSKGAVKDYEVYVRDFVAKTQAEAELDNVIVPRTVEAYLASGYSNRRFSKTVASPMPYDLLDHPEYDIEYVSDVDDDDDDCLLIYNSGERNVDRKDPERAEVSHQIRSNMGEKTVKLSNSNDGNWEEDEFEILDFEGAHNINITRGDDEDNAAKMNNDVQSDEEFSEPEWVVLEDAKEVSIDDDY